MYHAPPDKSPTSWVGKRFIGDSYLNECIEQYKPDLVFSGHIHESPFKKDGSWADKMGKPGYLMPAVILVMSLRTSLLISKP